MEPTHPKRLPPVHPWQFTNPILSHNSAIIPDLTKNFEELAKGGVGFYANAITAKLGYPENDLLLNPTLLD